MLGTIFLMLILFIFNAENLKMIEQNRRACTLNTCKGHLCWKVQNLFKRKKNKTKKKGIKKNMKDYGYDYDYDYDDSSTNYDEDGTYDSSESDSSNSQGSSESDSDSSEHGSDSDSGPPYQPDDSDQSNTDKDEFMPNVGNIDDKYETIQDFDVNGNADPDINTMDEKNPSSQGRAPRCRISRKYTLLSYYGTIFGE